LDLGKIGLIAGRAWIDGSLVVADGYFH
jgi:hypothetical protein